MVHNKLSTSEKICFSSSDWYFNQNRLVKGLVKMRPWFSTVVLSNEVIKLFLDHSIRLYIVIHLNLGVGVVVL